MLALRLFFSGAGVVASAPSSVAPFSVVPSVSTSERSFEGTEWARGSAMPRPAPVFAGASGGVSGRGASVTASPAMFVSPDVASSALLISGVSM